MAVQLDATTRNAGLDAYETSIGASPVLRIRTGTQPANCAAADSGTVLAALTLPADWMAAASGGTKALTGTWEDLSADATGTAGHWRLYDSGNVCRMQGSVTVTGGGGDLTVSSVDFVTGGAVTVTAFTWTAGNS